MTFEEAIKVRNAFERDGNVYIRKNACTIHQIYYRYNNTKPLEISDREIINIANEQNHPEGE